MQEQRSKKSWSQTGHCRDHSGCRGDVSDLGLESTSLAAVITHLKHMELEVRTPKICDR